MKYEGRTLEEALDIASKEEYVNKEDLVYSVVSNEEDKVEIEVYTIVDVIEYAQSYLKNSTFSSRIFVVTFLNYS